MSARSLPVSTPTTPGIRSASDGSSRAILACGSGLRRILPCSIPGTIRSPAHMARPVTFSRASPRRTDVPTILGIPYPLTSQSVRTSERLSAPGARNASVQTGGPELADPVGPVFRKEHVAVLGIVHGGGLGMRQRAQGAVGLGDGLEMEGALQREGRQHRPRHVLPHHV